jgi:hypothetical protein
MGKKERIPRLRNKTRCQWAKMARIDVFVCRGNHHVDKCPDRKRSKDEVLSLLTRLMQLDRNGLGTPKFF